MTPLPEAIISSSLGETDAIAPARTHYAVSPDGAHLTVSDGAIVRADASFEVEEFSPQMWEPFATWVSEAYPEHVTLMYEDETQGGMRLAEESVRLWKRHIREYVERLEA